MWVLGALDSHNFFHIIVILVGLDIKINYNLQLPILFPVIFKSPLENHSSKLNCY